MAVFAGSQNNRKFHHHYSNTPPANPGAEGAVGPGRASGARIRSFLAAPQGLLTPETPRRAAYAARRKRAGTEAGATETSRISEKAAELEPSASKISAAPPFVPSLVPCAGIRAGSFHLLQIAQPNTKPSNSDVSSTLRLSFSVHPLTHALRRRRAVRRSCVSDNARPGP